MNIRIVHKLLLGFCLLGIIIVVIAGGGFYSLSKSEKAAKQMDSLSQHRKVAQSVFIDFADIKNNIRIYAITGERKLIEQAREKIDSIAMVLRDEQKKDGLLHSDIENIKSILAIHESFLKAMDDVEATYTKKQSLITDHINKIGKETVQAVEGISEQAFFSGNSDAAVAAAVMRGHFLAAQLTANSVLSGGVGSEAVNAYRKSMSSYKESATSLSVYLTDKKQKEIVDNLEKDKRFDEAIDQIVMLNKKMDEQIKLLEQATIDVSQKIEAYQIGIKNQEDEVSSSVSNVISQFRLISMFILLIGGAASVSLVIYLFSDLKKTVELLSAGFDNTQRAILLVSKAANEVERNIGVMATSTENANQKGQEIDVQTKTMTENIAGMSSAMCQLNHSIDQIQTVTSGSLEKVGQAVSRATEMDRVMRELAIASEQINSVVSLINGLAEQTSLLALNATIEAARAGEAGKGFSVVADEVKKLAVETTMSTDNIRQQVGRIASISSEAISFMTDLTGYVQEIESNSTGINSSIAEQQLGTQSLGENVEKVMQVTSSVSDKIKSISDEMSRSGKLADDILTQTGLVIKEVGHLNGIADDFRKKLAKL